MIPAEARGAWSELRARLRPYVARRVLSAADADDVLQEVFVRVHRGLPELSDAERFGPWIYRIAANALADHARARVRHPLARGSDEPDESSAALEGPLPAAGDAVDDLVGELAECVALFVARLPSPYREAITLTELQGLTQKDAAQLLGITLSGMKSRVQRGRERIRRMFTECCEISQDARGRVLECTPRSLGQVPEDCRDAARSWSARRGR